MPHKCECASFSYAACVEVFVYDDGSGLRVVVTNTPARVRNDLGNLQRALQNATNGRVIIIDDYRYHTQGNEINFDWTDVFIHVVNPRTHAVEPAPTVLRLVDHDKFYLKPEHEEYLVSRIEPSVMAVSGAPYERGVLIALILIVVVLFVGLVAFLAVCCHARRRERKLTHATAVTAAATATAAADAKPVVEVKPTTTENPLWEEQKLRMYEEQELSMQVFPESDEAAAAAAIPMVNLDDRQGAPPRAFEPAEHTYATIDRPRGGATDASQSTFLSPGSSTAQLY
ncbi:PREDICTED: cadherin-87A-like [Priapulus caudatus]|uniref:Cadherin-87A-like n=1 Tax=Priapulus caudatus TaxID=37621 RepID=A0ABM1EY19_PRICU|nr:PREDICTED: cadherin-87A-like [Priapulus caudatus]